MQLNIRNGVLVKCSPPLFAATVILPEEVRVIGKRAFADETFLKRIYLQAPLTAIEDEAFLNCSHLKTIAPVSMKKYKGAYFPEGLCSVGKGAFQGCSLLCAVTLPSTVQSIEDEAFRWCFFLTDLTLPDTVQLMGGEILQEIRNAPVRKESYSIGGVMIKISVPDLVLHIRRSDGEIYDFSLPFPPSLSSDLVEQSVLELLLHKRFDAAIYQPERVELIRQMLETGYLTEDYLLSHAEEFLCEMVFDDNKEALQFLTERGWLFPNIPAELYEKMILYANELENYEMQVVLSDKMHQFTSGGTAGHFQL